MALLKPELLESENPLGVENEDNHDEEEEALLFSLSRMLSNDAEAFGAAIVSLNIFVRFKTASFARPASFHPLRFLDLGKTSANFQRFHPVGSRCFISQLRGCRVTAFLCGQTFLVRYKSLVVRNDGLGAGGRIVRIKLVHILSSTDFYINRIELLE